MIETVVSIALPVGERLTIEKNRLLPQGADSETDRNKNRKRLAIVTGIHGDELEGQSVCYELNRRLAAHLYGRADCGWCYRGSVWCRPVH